MKIYRFSGLSPIKEVAIYQYKDRLPVALLTANDNAPADKIVNIRKEIEVRGWQCVPVTVEGRDVLQVNGFKNEEECKAFLISNQFVAGAPEITDETQESLKPAARSVIHNFFRRHSLRIAGILNLIGDVGFLGNGIKTNDKHKITGGSLYTLGGLNLTLFGRSEKPEYNLRKVSQRTVEFIEKVPGGSPENSAYLHNGELNHTEHFLHRNAANNALAVYTLGAGAMLSSGIKKYHAGQGVTGLYYGISSVFFKLASLFVPEKARNDGYDSNENKKSAKSEGFFGKAINWVREKPLRIFGYGSLVSDSFLALDTYQEFKRNPRQNNYLWAGLTSVTYLLADCMMAISNKDPENAADKFDPYEQRQVVGLAAEAIAAHPREQREMLVKRVSKFLVAQPEMKGSPAEISESIKKQMQNRGHNPWVDRTTSNEALQLSI